MAIPHGTTARQVQALARWALAAMYLAGLLTWWRGGYAIWGGLAGGTMLVLSLWLVWKTVAGDSHLPAQPMHLILLGPAVILTYHLARTGLGTERLHFFDLAGGLNISLIFHLGLMSAGIMLTQGLLATVGRLGIILSVAGAAMFLGPVAAIKMGAHEVIHPGLVMVSFAGLAVWLAPLAMPRRDADGDAGATLRAAESAEDERFLPPGMKIAHWCDRHRWWLARAGVAVAGCAYLLTRWPHGSAPAVGSAGVVLLLWSLVARRGRLAAAALGAAMTAGGAWLLRGQAGSVVAIVETAAGSLGIGERAFALEEISARSDALSIAAMMTGRVGLAWMGAAMILALVWVLYHVRKAAPIVQVRALIWTVAATWTAAAVLLPGGLFVPAMTLSVAMVWGFMPMMIGRPERRAPGAILLAFMLAMILLLGLARNEGMLGWIGEMAGNSDLWLHGATGFLVAMTAGWLIGGRRVYLGVLAIVFVAAAGGAAEVLQSVAAARSMEVSDWLFHAAGSALAAVIYVLAMGGRMCESGDTRRQPTRTNTK